MSEPIKRGDYFEDCGFGPALCVHVEDCNGKSDLVHGISLVDGGLRTCALSGCAPRKLSFAQAVHARFRGPDADYIKRCQSRPTSEWKPENRWWEEEGRSDWADEVLDVPNC